MYESKIIKLKEVPVFSLSDVSQIVSGKEYAKKFLRRKIISGEIKRIKRDSYTFDSEPFLVSTFLVKPSYISSASALSYHKLITQIPKDIFCFTPKKNINFKFYSEIKFIHTNYFFGFELKDYENFKIPIATPEKAIIDSIGIVPFSIFEEAMEKIDPEKIIEYLKKIKKSSIVKRIGYLLEKNGLDISKKIKKYINNRYIYLDPLAKNSGKKNKKWRLIINI
jgi:predicted transcriptional regulator of viral defense system